MLGVLCVGVYGPRPMNPTVNGASPSTRRSLATKNFSLPPVIDQGNPRSRMSLISGSEMKLQAKRSTFPQAAYHEVNKPDAR